MHLTYRCRFLNCSVRMGGGVCVEGFVMNSEGISGGGGGGNQIRYLLFFVRRRNVKEPSHATVPLRWGMSGLARQLLLLLLLDRRRRGDSGLSCSSSVSECGRLQLLPGTAARWLKAFFGEETDILTEYITDFFSTNPATLYFRRSHRPNIYKDTKP